MVVFFNWIGVFEFGVCFLTGIVLQVLLGFIGLSAGVRNVITLIICSIVIITVMIIGDFRYRLNVIRKNGEKTYKIIYPNRGGHIFFIPSFILGGIIIIIDIMEVFK